MYKYTMDSRTIIAALRADGWVQVGQKGSHLQFKHPSKPGRTTVPHPETFQSERCEASRFSPDFS